MTETKQKRATATLGLYTSFGCLSGVIHFGSPYHLKIRNSMNPVEHDPDMIPMIQVPQLNATSLGLPCRFSQLHYPSPATLSVLPSGDVNTHALKSKEKTWILWFPKKNKNPHSQTKFPTSSLRLSKHIQPKSLNTTWPTNTTVTSAHRFRADNSAPQLFVVRVEVTGKPTCKWWTIKSAQ